MATTGPKGRGTWGRRPLPVRGPLQALLLGALELPPVRLRFLPPGRKGRHLEREAPFLFPYRWPELQELRERLRAVDPETFGPQRAWHTFRHTLAWELLRAGKSRELVREVLGHESAATSERYCSRLMGAEVRSEAFEGLDESA